MRTEAQEAFQKDKIRVIVATLSFGMGIGALKKTLQKRWYISF
jgi:hypothetical protein